MVAGADCGGSQRHASVSVHPWNEGRSGGLRADARDVRCHAQGWRVVRDHHDRWRRARDVRLEGSGDAALEDGNDRGAGKNFERKGSYEIQVYGSDLVAPGNTMFELHSNFTFMGVKAVVDGMYPTEHQLHETLEITHGFNDWFELGFYVFTSADSRVGWQWVGDHIRPRVAVPKSGNWPVGVTLSFGVGYQRAVYSPDTWTIEIRPIVDKTIGRLYLGFNPTIDRSFHGPSVPMGVTFSPNVKAG